jgi:hypothetical protein
MPNTAPVSGLIIAEGPTPNKDATAPAVMFGVPPVFFGVLTYAMVSAPLLPAQRHSLRARVPRAQHLFADKIQTMYNIEHLSVDEDYSRALGVVADELFRSGQDISIRTALTMLVGGSEERAPTSTLVVAASRLLDLLALEKIDDPDRPYFEFTDRVGDAMVQIWHLGLAPPDHETLVKAVLRSIANDGVIEDLDEASAQAISLADPGYLMVAMLQITLGLSYLLSENDDAGEPLRVVLDVTD